MTNQEALLRLISEPTRTQRVLSAILLALVLVNLFYHGAQPYAVGLFMPPWDKVAHMTLFLGVSSLLWVSTGARSALAVVALAALVGASDEFWQSFHPGRTVDIMDWATDVVSSVLAVTLVLILRRMLAAYLTRQQDARRGVTPRQDARRSA